MDTNFLPLYTEKCELFLDVVQDIRVGGSEISTSHGLSVWVSFLISDLSSSASRLTCLSSLPIWQTYNHVVQPLAEAIVLCTYLHQLSSLRKLQTLQSILFPHHLEWFFIFDGTLIHKFSASFYINL